MNCLYIIPARGGSKGIPRKNIKLFNGKPLIYYAIDNAREMTSDSNICVSTDDDEIIKVVEDYGLKVSFKRPSSLATDTSGTFDVLTHALEFYKDRHYDAIVLLQTTSPFRQSIDIKNALKLYTPDIDMVVSVTETNSNPYYNCFEEDKDGYLHISKGDGSYTRRQDIPKVYEYNGAIYIINIESLKKKKFSNFTKRKKYVMKPELSIDLDTPLDWEIAEYILKRHE